MAVAGTGFIATLTPLQVWPPVRREASRSELLGEKGWERGPFGLGDVQQLHSAESLLWELRRAVVAWGPLHPSCPSSLAGAKRSFIGVC